MGMAECVLSLLSGLSLFSSFDASRMDDGPGFDPTMTAVSATWRCWELLALLLLRRWWSGASLSAGCSASIMIMIMIVTTL
jgi:hypothetical protein